MRVEEIDSIDRFIYSDLVSLTTITILDLTHPCKRNVVDWVMRPAPLERASDSMEAESRHSFHSMRSQSRPRRDPHTHAPGPRHLLAVANEKCIQNSCLEMHSWYGTG